MNTTKAKIEYVQECIKHAQERAEENGDVFLKNDGAYLIEDKVIPHLEIMQTTLQDRDFNSLENNVGNVLSVMGDLISYLKRWTEQDRIKKELESIAQMQEK